MIVLFASALLVFVIACLERPPISILARNRPDENPNSPVSRGRRCRYLGHLRVSLLAESLVLCGAGAGLGVLLGVGRW